jgi:hypothetical protein
MSKVALLIGVSEYQSSEFQDLAAVERDVAAMRDVLVQPGIGGFAEVDVTVLDRNRRRCRRRWSGCLRGGRRIVW